MTERQSGTLSIFYSFSLSWTHDYHNGGTSTPNLLRKLLLLLELTLAHTNFNLDLDVSSLLVKQYMEKEIVFISRIFGRAIMPHQI